MVALDVDAVDPDSDGRDGDVGGPVRHLGLRLHEDGAGRQRGGGVVRVGRRVHDVIEAPVQRAAVGGAPHVEVI